MPDSPGALTGVTVIDLSRVLAGPYCTMVLADLGARVIKVEQPPDGDDARRIGPFVDGRSAYFASVNRGKESIALDLSVGADRSRFERLLEGADVGRELPARPPARYRARSAPAVGRSRRSASSGRAAGPGW